MTWTRKGECSNCGWCCVAIGQDVSQFRMIGPEADVEFFKIRGFQLFSDQSGKVVAATRLCDCAALCPQYDGEHKQCRIYDTRPITCVDFPAMPEQIRYTPCSYWFEDENGNKVGGQSSPHPVPIPVFKPGA